MVVVTVLMPVMVMMVAIVVMAVVVVMMMVMMPVMVTSGLCVAQGICMSMRHARVGAEHQRLDRDGHREGRHAHATQVDVIEVPQSDAVEHQHLGRYMELVLQNRAKRLCDICIQDKEQGLPFRMVSGSASTRARANAAMRGYAGAPLQRNASAISDCPSTTSNLRR